MSHLLILCPLPIEAEAILIRMRERGHEHLESQAGPLKIMEFPDLRWRMALAGHGKVQFGIQTQFLIGHYGRLDAVICAGCAGGLAESISISDVVAAESTVEHDYRLRFVSRPYPDFPGDKKLLERIAS